MKLTILLTTACLICVGCQTIKPINASKDGKPLYETICRTTTAECHRMASAQCNGEYNVVSQSNWLSEQHMIIACKNP